MNENLVGDISIADKGIVDKDTLNKKEPDSRPGTYKTTEVNT